MSRWFCARGGGLPSEVWPEDDLRAHVLVEHGGECWCDPLINEDGTIVHNAADQREKFEAKERQRS